MGVAVFNGLVSVTSPAFSYIWRLQIALPVIKMATKTLEEIPGAGMEDV